MRRVLAAVMLALAASAAAAPAQTGADAARAELDAGARLYRVGRFEEAEQHFRRAVELDPAGKQTRLLIARALRRRYGRGVTTPENMAAGARAASAYQEVLRLDPGDDDAFKELVNLYRQMGHAEQVNVLLLRRANDDAVPGEKRAGAFASLAAEQWKCANRITEQPSSKKPSETAEGGGAYTMPANEGEFILARRCVTDGLAFTRRALELDPKSLDALSNESRLLLEAIKLVQMEGDLAREAELVRRQQASQEAFEGRREEVRLAAAAERAARRAAEDGGGGDDEDAAEDSDESPAEPAAAAPDPAGPPAGAAAGPVGVRGDAAPGTPGAQKSTDAPEARGEPVGKKIFVEGGILNGKVVSRLTPAYPDGAKRAGAQGTVTVRVVVDEEGRVVEAEAADGHPLLREAAVAAARLARLSPTRLSGRPVSVTGFITYNFVLGAKD